MANRYTTFAVWACIVFAMGSIDSVRAQGQGGSGSSGSLRYKIDQIFDEVLLLQLGGSPGEHGSHFSRANVTSSDRTIKALTNFIGTNISSFPLSSTGATAVFDLSTGVPIRQVTSLGPIFSENGTTLGKGRVILGYNFTFMKLNQIRGLDTRDLRFTFTHQDVGEPGLGDSDNEFDTIDLFMDLQLNASILALYLTAGVTDRLDVGAALPLVNVNVRANPAARINSFTLVRNDSANHFYGGTRTAPILTTTPTPLDDDATGIGDIALRAKYNFYRGDAADFAAMVEARLPTGDEENFLGSGDTTVKIVLIASRAWELFSPHLNLAYDIRTGDLQNDRIEVFTGFDQKLNDRFTVVGDFLGRFEVGDPIEELQFDQTATMRRPLSDTEFVQTVNLTNMPQSDHDDLMDLSFGVKYSPTPVLVLIGNILLPLNDGGLRADVIPTVGFEFNF